MSQFLDEDAIRQGLVGTMFSAVTVVPETGSTNADLAAEARAGAEAGRALLSAYQHSGRGRFTRAWEAPPETAVATSVLVEPHRELREWGWLSLLVGVAVVDGIVESTGLPAVLKWPNDVQIHGKKVCGILSERVAVEGRELAVLGWGMNVALTEDQLPVPTATSLRLEGSDVAASDLAAAVLRSLSTWFQRWDAGESVVEGYRERCGTLGLDVAVHVGAAEPVRGRAIDIDPDGCLVVATATEVRSFAAGDVVHLRPGE